MSADLKLPPLTSGYAPAAYGTAPQRLRSAAGIAGTAAATTAAAAAAAATAAATLSPNPATEETARGTRQDRESKNKASDLAKVVDETNKRLEMDDIGVRFRIFEERVQIQIVDSQRDRVVRSVPSDEMIRLSARMRELSGVGALVDRSL